MAHLSAVRIFTGALRKLVISVQPRRIKQDSQDADKQERLPMQRPSLSAYDSAARKILAEKVATVDKY